MVPWVKFVGPTDESLISNCTDQMLTEVSFGKQVSTYSLVFIILKQFSDSCEEQLIIEDEEICNKETSHEETSDEDKEITIKIPQED